jgi:hypothetical protein
MATGAFPPVVTTNEVSVGITHAANFIPEVWSNETIASYKANLVLAGLVTTFPFSGRKGDTFHIPSPTRGAANAKGAVYGSHFDCQYGRRHRHLDQQALRVF